MATLKRILRKPASSERGPDTGTIEAAALGTTTGAMLLGLLAGTVETRHSHQTAAPGLPDDRPGDAAPLPAAHDVWPDFAPFSFALNPKAAANADISASSSPTGERGMEIRESAAAGAMASTGDMPVSPPANSFLDSTNAGAAAASDSNLAIDGAPEQADSVNTGTVLHDISTAITATLDSSFATLNSTLSSLTASVQQLTQALPDAADFSETVSTVTQSALTAPAAVAGAFVETVFQASTAAPAADPVLLDASAAVPVAPALAPLSLGFMGQPQPDGQDTHDGAFSALGLHHF